MKTRIVPVGFSAAAGRAGVWRCRCLAVWLLLLVARGAEGQDAPPGAGPPPAAVTVAEVSRAEVDTRRTFVGTVMPLRTSIVGSPVEGLVVELTVREGDKVQQGDTLAQLRDQQLKLQLAAAEAELQVRTQQQSELKISLPQQVQQADARSMAAKALMDFTARRLQRMRKLLANRTIAEDELQETESAAVAAQEKHREARTALDEARLVLPAKLSGAEALVLAQRRQIDRLKDEVALHRITAPFDGYVAREHTEVGQWLAKGAQVVELVQVDTVEIEVGVPESYIAKLQLGTKAVVTVGALPGKSWQAPVAAIVPQADLRSRSFPVKVRLKNSPGPGGVLLKPGMFARVGLPVGGRRQALMVPKDAVVLGGPAPVVFVVGPPPNHIAQRVPVELGTAEGDLIEVRGSLKPGQRVVEEGNERLRPGQPLKIVTPRRTPQKPAAAKTPR